MKIINLLPKHYLEIEFFEKMFLFLDKNILSDKTIYISNDYKQLPEYGKDIIAILTAGDELGKPPQYAKKVQYVFKHHLDVENIGNVYHIPLPYPNKFSGHAKIPIEKRSIDVFFAGCRRGSRVQFLSGMKKFMKNSKLRFNIKITGKFQSGYPIKTYSDLMSNSKIVLSPRGWYRNECLRFSEAVRCGCAIIAEPQPDIRCFRNIPYRSINKWTYENLVKDVTLCLQHQKKISEGVKMFWESHFSPQAVAYKINNVVGESNVY